MVSFSKLPGMVAFCIVVLTRTLGSAAPVPQTNDDGAATDHGLASISGPLLSDVADPLLTGVGRGVASLADGTLADILDDIVEGAGDALANLAPAVHDTISALQESDGLLGEVISDVGGDGSIDGGE